MSSAPTVKIEAAGRLPHPLPTPAHKWLVAVAVMLGATLEVLDTSIVNVSLPHMQGSFSASRDEITWVLTSYLVANGIMIPLTGWISVRFGRKRYFLFSVVVFVLSSGLCGAANSLGQIVVFRLVQGAAGAAMVPSSQAILMETFPPEEHGLAMSVWGMGMLTSPLVGPTVGGWITYIWSWRWNFYVNLPIGMFAAMMAMFFVDDPEHIQRSRAAPLRIDYLGIVYMVLGLGFLQIVLDRGQRAGWFEASWVCVLTAMAALALLRLVVHEFRFPEPVLDLGILTIPAFDISVGIILLMIVVMFGVNLLNPLFFQELLGYSPWKSRIRGVAARLRCPRCDVAGWVVISPCHRYPVANRIGLCPDRRFVSVDESVDTRRQYRERSFCHDSVGIRSRADFPIAISISAGLRGKGAPRLCGTT